MLNVCDGGTENDDGWYEYGVCVMVFGCPCWCCDCVLVRWSLLSLEWVVGLVEMLAVILLLWLMVAVDSCAMLLAVV